MALLPRAYEFGTHKDDGFSEKRIVSKQAGLLPTLTVDCEPNFRSGLRCGSFDQDMSQYDLDIQAGIKIMVVREDSWGLHDFARKGESLEKILAAVKYRATLVHDHPTNHLRIDMWSQGTPSLRSGALLLLCSQTIMSDSCRPQQGCCEKQ